MSDSGENAYGKVLVIGLDGVTFDLVDPWVRMGKLPNLARLMEEGVSGNLRSTTPPLSPPAWASFMTGKNPGKHGIFDFVKRSSGGNTFQAANGSCLQARPFWSILSGGGRRVGVVNIPMTYPPIEVNGFLISGMDSPKIDQAYTFPESLSSEIQHKFGEYVVDCKTSGRGSTSVAQFTEQYVQNLHHMIENRGAVASYLLAKYRPDFFMVTFIATDRIQHAFGKLLDQDHLAGEASGAAREDNPVLGVYERVDQQVGRLLGLLDDKWTVIIMSDHGASRYTKVFNLSYWLFLEGLLNISPQKRLGSLLSNYHRVRAGVLSRLKGVPPERRNIVSESWFFRSIDWPRTKAYSFGAFGGTFVNLRGREPNGIVEPGDEYEALCERVRGALLSVKDPETGEKVINAVYHSKEIYRGDCVAEAPDLLVETEEPYFIRNSLRHYETQLVYDAGKYGRRQLEHTGKHHPNGILIAAGPQVRKGTRVDGARIVDLAPTILYLQGIPVPTDMDGQVLTSLFKPEWLATKPVQYSEASRDITTDHHGDGYGDGEEEEVLERLRGLGYIE
jgi:predicted AlkP superfamily phosphohydrolase/phosphomutase